MEGQREKLNGNRRRRRRNKSESKTQTAPILIAARRPDSPRMGKISRRNIAASARPKRNGSTTSGEAVEAPEQSDAFATDALTSSAGSAADRGETERDAEKPRRVARIALAPSAPSVADETAVRR